MAQQVQYDEHGLIKNQPKSNAEKRAWLLQNDRDFPQNKCCFSCFICGPIYALSYSGCNNSGTGGACGFGYGMTLFWGFLGWVLGWLQWFLIIGEIIRGQAKEGLSSEKEQDKFVDWWRKQQDFLLYKDIGPDVRHLGAQEGFNLSPQQEKNFQKNYDKLNLELYLILIILTMVLNMMSIHSCIYSCFSKWVAKRLEPKPTSRIYPRYSQFLKGAEGDVEAQPQPQVVYQYGSQQPQPPPSQQPQPQGCPANEMPPPPPAGGDDVVIA